MLKLVTLLLLGISMICIGINNIRGNISSIHWYNRKKVKDSDIPKYGKCIGVGSAIIGMSLIISALLEMIFKSSVYDYIIIVGCVIGVIVILYGQIKYNKGIF